MMGNVTTRKYMSDTASRPPLHPPLEFFCISAPGLESITAAELRELGLAPRVVTGGVAVTGTIRDVYSCNLWSRTASRVLVRVMSAHASSFHELERRARRIPWSRYVPQGASVRFRVTCHKSALYHSDAVGQRLGASAAAAVGTSVRADDARKGAESDSSAQLFLVRLDHDVMTLSVDSSGDLLHRRGYRQAVAKAPLRETLAAAMLLSSGWRSDQPLLDPMCGSGTIAIEAALMARRIAPGLQRDFAFMRWPDFDAELWRELKEGALVEQNDGAHSPIAASDRDAGAVRATIENATRAGVPDDISVAELPLSATKPIAAAPGWLITNPPYGVRVGSDVRNLYARLGSLMRDEFAGWRLGLLSASPPPERQLRLALERMFETSNGGIPVRFLVSRSAE